MNEVGMAGDRKLLWKHVSAIILLIPAMYFIIGSVIKYDFGFSNSFVLLDWFQKTDNRRFYFNLNSPVVFFGGSLLATIIHLPVRFSSDILQQLKLKNLLKNPGLSLPIIVTAVLLMMILSIYIIGETILSHLPE